MRCNEQHCEWAGVQSERLLDVISISVLFFCFITSLSACHLPSSLQQQYPRQSSPHYTAADADQSCESQLMHGIDT